MSRRPEILFPLFASLETLPGVGPKVAKLLGACRGAFFLVKQFANNLVANDDNYALAA